MGGTWQGLSGDVLYQGKNIADADGQEIVSGREVFSAKAADVPPSSVRGF